MWEITVRKQTAFAGQGWAAQHVFPPSNCHVQILQQTKPMHSFHTGHDIQQMPSSFTEAKLTSQAEEQPSHTLGFLQTSKCTSNCSSPVWCASCTSCLPAMALACHEKSHGHESPALPLLFNVNHIRIYKANPHSLIFLVKWLPMKCFLECQVENSLNPTPNSWKVKHLHITDMQHE